MMQLEANFKNGLQLNQMNSDQAMNNSSEEEAPPPVEVTPNQSQPEQQVKNEQLSVVDVNKKLMENYEKYCHIRYKDIITKRPDLLQNNDLVTKIIVEEWEKKTNEEKLYINFDALTQE